MKPFDISLPLVVGTRLHFIMTAMLINVAYRCLCNAALNSFKEAICQSAAVNSNKVFEAGRRLRPDYLAIEMLDVSYKFIFYVFF